MALVIKKRLLNPKFGGTLEVTKQFFFDRARVVAMVNARERRAMVKIGGFIRVTAKRSMRKSTKTKPYSAVGQPPRYHTKLIRDFIYFSYSPTTHSVVAGPEKLRVNPIVKPVSQPTIPALHEYGGTAIAGSSTFVYGPVKDKFRSFNDPKRKKKTRTRLLVTAVLPPGPRNYEPRPYMRPALAKAIEAPRLKEAWEVI